MRKYPIDRLCRRGVHCPTCRDREGGRTWRESVIRYARVPGGKVDWVCRYGRDWGVSPSVPDASLSALPPMPPDPYGELYKRIGDACVACRAKLQDPSKIDSPDIDAIEDCPFAALPACQRRSLIRAGQAVCPLGVWQCGVDPAPINDSPPSVPALQDTPT